LHECAEASGSGGAATDPPPIGGEFPDSGATSVTLLTIVLGDVARKDIEVEIRALLERARDLSGWLVRDIITRPVAIPDVGEAKSERSFPQNCLQHTVRFETALQIRNALQIAIFHCQEIDYSAALSLATSAALDFASLARACQGAEDFLLLVLETQRFFIAFADTLTPRYSTMSYVIYGFALRIGELSRALEEKAKQGYKMDYQYSLFVDPFVSCLDETCSSIGCGRLAALQGVSGGALRSSSPSLGKNLNETSGSDGAGAVAEAKVCIPYQGFADTPLLDTAYHSGRKDFMLSVTRNVGLSAIVDRDRALRDKVREIRRWNEDLRTSSARAANEKSAPLVGASRPAPGSEAGRKPQTKPPPPVTSEDLEYTTYKCAKYTLLAARRISLHEYTLGAALFNAGRYREAAEWLEKAIWSCRDLAGAWELLGRTYLALGFREKSREAASRALEIEPTSMTACTLAHGFTQGEISPLIRREGENV